MNNPDLNNERILDYFRKTDKLETYIVGIDGNNGLRSKVQEHEKYINEIKPQLQDLLHHAKSLDEIKKNLWRIVVILITTAIITICSKFIQIKTNNETLHEIKTMSEEAKH